MKKIILLIALTLSFGMIANAQCPTINGNGSVSPLFPMSGQEIQTVYLNYPSSAQAVTIAVNPTGGTAPYSYVWYKSNCNGSTLSVLATSDSFYTFAPSSADICAGNNDNVTTFTVSISDANGCNTTVTKKINVVDPYVGGNVQVCHKVAVRGGSTTQIMILAPNQVYIHLAHGDYLGNCPIFTGN